MSIKKQRTFAGYTFRVVDTRGQSERETEWYVRDMSECDELLSALDVIVNQADRFVREICAETNVSTAGVPLCPYGTARYKRVSDASDQLNYIEVELTNGPNRFTGRPVWERKRVDGKYAGDIVQQLQGIKRCLQKDGEGANQP